MEKLIRSTKKISYIDENGNISYIDSSDKICLAREEIVEGKKVIKKLLQMKNIYVIFWMSMSKWCEQREELFWKMELKH